MRCRKTQRAAWTVTLWMVAASVCASQSACRSQPDADGIRAEFGVLYGGDVQDRPSIPLELEPSRQEIGLRVTFAHPLERDRHVRWELERPTARRSPDGGVLYAAELGERWARKGEQRVDAKLRFRRGDPLGGWRIRVFVDERLVHERAFEVVPP